MTVLHHRAKQKSGLQEGLSIVEVIFVTGISLILLVALVGIASVSVKTSGFSKNQTTATKLAKDEMELIRAVRDQKGIVELINCIGLKCSMLSGVTVDPNPETGIDGKFTRYFEVVSSGTCPTPEAPGKQIVQVTVYVTWKEGSGSSGLHETNLVSCFGNWQ